MFYLRFPGFLDKALTLSYDDGVVHDKRLMDILDKHGIKATFNLNSGEWAAQPGTGRFTREQALEVYSNCGHEVAVHGHKHLHLNEVSNAKAVYDVIHDRLELESMFGKVVRGMAYAYGTYNDEVVEILRRCGIVYSRTTVSTERFDIPTDWLRMPATCHHKNPRLMKLFDDFLDNSAHERHRQPRLFYLWGHSYEFNNDNNWHVIEQFCEKAGGREDVWYATNIEVYEYVKAFKSLVYSADEKLVYNPTATDVYLNVYGKKVLAKAGETVAVE